MKRILFLITILTILFSWEILSAQRLLTCQEKAQQFVGEGKINYIEGKFDQAWNQFRAARTCRETDQSALTRDIQRLLIARRILPLRRVTKEELCNTFRTFALNENKWKPEFIGRQNFDLFAYLYLGEDFSFSFLQFRSAPQLNANQVAPLPGVNRLWIIYHKNLQDNGGLYYWVQPFANEALAQKACQEYQQKNITCQFNPDLTHNSYVLSGLTPYLTP